MGKVYEEINEEQIRWIGEQQMFFVATAAPDAHVNLSPRGLDTFRVLGTEAGWRGSISRAAASRP